MNTREWLEMSTLALVMQRKSLEDYTILHFVVDTTVMSFLVQIMLSLILPKNVHGMKKTSDGVNVSPASLFIHFRSLCILGLSFQVSVREEHCRQKLCSWILHERAQCKI